MRYRPGVTHRALFLALLAPLLAACASAPETPRTSTLPVRFVAQAVQPTADQLAVHQRADERSAPDQLTVVSINLAHGRGLSRNQLLVGAKQIRHNLDAVAEFLRRSDADIVALQEVDSPSAWSGGFDHVAYLAEAAGLPYTAYAEHARLWLGNYGTAVLSRQPIRAAIGHHFPATPPTARKGFTLAQVAWGEQLLDIVSVHLDFSRQSVRQRQVDELLDLLSERAHPAVIMGDFNNEWLVEHYMVANYRQAGAVADSTGSATLKVYPERAGELATYKDKRLDWIALSPRLRFAGYQVASEPLSDHRAVIAHIELDVSGGTL